MGYYEWRCEDCKNHFDCTTDDGKAIEFFCPECKSENLNLQAFDQDTPTLLQSLINQINRLSARVHEIDKAMGLESDLLIDDGSGHEH